jgi:hypothetical protein
VPAGTTDATIQERLPVMAERWYGLVVCCFVLIWPAAPGHAQLALPLVDEVDYAALRGQCERLLKALAALKAPFSADTEKELQTLLRDKPAEPRVAAEKLQKLLDGRCLVGVSINPESRVKAARGPAVAELKLDQPVYVIVKVHNDGGVTAPLAVRGPQLRSADNKGPDQWLEAAVVTDAPLAKNLSGGKVDYVLVRLTAREAGKREATLQFDVGQGTQDLGFRAEVPILFTVRK